MKKAPGLILGILGIIVPIFALAQSSPAGVGITITPLTFELTANPGEAVSNSIRVSNASGAAVIFEMEVEDFTSAGEKGEVIVDPSSDETFSLKKWITTSPSRFTLESGQTQVVDFSINVPEGAEPGGHYGTVLASVKGTIGVTGAAISPKVGSLILLSVSGPIREEMFVREFTVPQFSQFGPVPFKVRLENTGSVHVKPIGFVGISDMFGKRVADIELPQKRILPGNTREIDLSWDKKFPLGKYTATLVTSFGVSNTPLSAVTTFWVFPWKIALEILICIAVVIAVLVKTRKRFAVAFRILVKGERGISDVPDR
jgi:hypothetical protein